MSLSGWAVLVWLLGQTDASAKDESEVTVWGGIELGAAAFPSGPSPGSVDGFGFAQPMVAAEIGEGFALELGARVRFRVYDQPPAERGESFTSWIRAEDFDESSDFGQILRLARVGRDGERIYLLAGPMRLQAIGQGRLLNRYDNTLNPDYHPAGVSLKSLFGPVRVEALTSDLFSGRIIGLDVGVDLARALNTRASAFDRYHIGFGFARDGGISRFSTTPVSLGSVDLDAALYRSSTLQVFGLAGVGARLVTQRAWGVGGGFAAQTRVSAMQLTGKVELRHQQSGFRHGLFGPGYELARYASIGFDGPSVVDERLPTGASIYGEIGLAFADGALTGSIESLFRRRTDFDVSVVYNFAQERGLWVVRAGSMGIGERPRYLLSTETRFRFLPSLYGLATVHLMHFPQPDNSLRQGWGLGLGVGGDFEF